MQRRRSPGSLGLVLAIIIGLIAGIVFYIRDTAVAPAPTSQSLVPTPPPATTEAPTVAAVISATALPRYDLFIPTVGIWSNIRQLPFDASNGTWNLSLLGSDVGHLQRTAWLDAPGNIVIVGHVEMADGSAGSFAPLGQVGSGTLIYILDENHDTLRTYQVTETRITTPDDLSVLYSTPDDRLTLITCDGYDLLSNTYTARVVTVALRIA